MKCFFSYLLSSSLLILPLSALVADATPQAPAQHSILAPKEPTQTTAPAPVAPPAVDTTEETTAPSYQGALTKMLLTLGGLLALVFLTIWALKKLTQGKIGSYKKNRSMLWKDAL